MSLDICETGFEGIGTKPYSGLIFFLKFEINSKIFQTLDPFLREWITEMFLKFNKLGSKIIFQKQPRVSQDSGLKGATFI